MIESAQRADSDSVVIAGQEYRPLTLSTWAWIVARYHRVAAACAAGKLSGEQFKQLLTRMNAVYEKVSKIYGRARARDMMKKDK
jgi:hypothetical protein